MPTQPRSELDPLVAAAPEPFPARFATCDDVDPPVRLHWLMPYASGEEHVVTAHGWRELLRLIGTNASVPWDIGRATIA